MVLRQKPCVDFIDTEKFMVLFKVPFKEAIRGSKCYVYTALKIDTEHFVWYLSQFLEQIKHFYVRHSVFYVVSFSPVFQHIGSWGHNAGSVKLDES